MNTYISSLLLAGALFAAGVVQAQQSAHHAPSHTSATQRALAAQRSGEIASSTEQHLSGKVRAAAYKRYVDSFTQPIPASFIDDSFTSGE